MKRSLVMRAARGFGLVEIMISLVLASFLVLGLATMVANVQGTYSNQTEFAAVNDKERYAASLFQDLIMTSGYFSLSQVTQTYLNSNQLPTAKGALPAESASGYSYGIGQGLSGGYGGSATTPDTLNVRFQAVSGDGGSPFNCLGQTAAPTGSTGSQLATGVYESQLSISSAGNLVCETGSGSGLGTTQTVLIDGVSNMKILYGIDTLNNGYVTQYVNASNIAGANWFLVRSVQVTLTFKTATMAGNVQPTFTQIYQVKYSENSQR